MMNRAVHISKLRVRGEKRSGSVSGCCVCKEISEHIYIYMIIDRFTGTVVPRKAIVCIVCWLAGPKKSVLNSPISFATGGRWPATSLVRSANSTPSKSSIYIYIHITVCEPSTSGSSATGLGRTSREEFRTSFPTEVEEPYI